MGWTGSGALIAWHDVENGREAEYLDWHSHEHMRERRAIPGFLQARRYSVVDSGPQFLVLYTVTDPDVFISQTYLEHLNHPTDWTQQVMPALRNMNRSLCRVAASSGSGAGRCLQTIRFSSEPGREAHLRGVLTSEAQSLAHQQGLCAAHLLIADQDRSRTPTRETALWAGQAAVADWVLVVEGYDEAAVAEDRSGLLRQSGAGPEITGDLYRMDHICF
jgi:heme-degrading monooxygenase HmoA